MIVMIWEYWTNYEWNKIVGIVILSAKSETSNDSIATQSKTELSRKEDPSLVKHSWLKRHRDKSTKQNNRRTQAVFL